MVRSRLFVVLVLTVFALIQLVPGGNSAARSTQAPLAVTHTIEFGGLLGSVYQPSQLFIAPGDSVRWQGEFLFHPLASDTGLWTTVSSGSEFTFTFSDPGVYSYHCTVHGLFGMTGTITVGYRNFMPMVGK